MALSYSSMADKIEDFIGGLNGSQEQKDNSRKFIEAICKGIIKEIQENGEVAVNGVGNDGANVHSIGKMS